MKSFAKALRYKWQAGASHAFVLYLNVWDEILNPTLSEKGTIEQMSDHLLSSSVVGDALFAAFFDRGRGIRFPTKKTEERFLEFLAKLHPETNVAGKNAAVELFHVHRQDPSLRIVYALQLFNEMLAMSRAEYRKIMDDGSAEPVDADEAKKPFFAAVIEYTHTMTSATSAAQGDREDRDSLVTFLSWARSREMADARNLFVLITDSLEGIAPELRSETNGFAPLKVFFPDAQEREQVIAFYFREFAPESGSLDATTFARASAGLSRRVLGALIKEAHTKSKPITGDYVFSIKKKAIDEQSGGLVEVIQPLWGIDAIGGLESHKAYIAEVVAALKAGKRLAVPMGILLLGAPGVGKTAFAEAIAYEAGIPFVKLRNIREMWVGQSERNQDFAFELIAAMAPVVVFVDEVDQEYGGRSGGPGDNTGVNNRLMRRQFEFMSDTTLRGKVIWLAASNRPDLLDPAMLREGRFDERVPFFPPDANERAKIFVAILHKMKVHAESIKEEFRCDPALAEFAEEFSYLARRHLNGDKVEPCDPEDFPPGKPENDKVLPFTGAQIEAVLRKAHASADSSGKPLNKEHVQSALKDFIPSQNFAQHRLMTEAAIMHCNSERFFPEAWKKRIASMRRASSSSGGVRIT
jgi:transitional endoplasmic reticulum ATPase